MTFGMLDATFIVSSVKLKFSLVCQSVVIKGQEQSQWFGRKLYQQNTLLKINMTMTLSQMNSLTTSHLRVIFQATLLGKIKNLILRSLLIHQN